MIALEFVTPVVILAGLVGAVGWGLITWWLADPNQFLACAAGKLCRRRDV